MVSACASGRVVCAIMLQVYASATDVLHSQDTNPIQYRLMVLLAKSHRRLTIVGDPDQSSESNSFTVSSTNAHAVYGWRSAGLHSFCAEQCLLLNRTLPQTQKI
jgi:hypothetical protein